MNKKNRYIGLVMGIILLSLISYGIMIPAAQSSANSHTYSGRFLGILYYSSAVFMLLWGTRFFRKDRDIKPLLLTILFAGIVIYWGHELRSLYCLGCANGG
ncbi:MAG: hypothetical protein GY810_29065 [Aureispira sp.]|nr:hypothetical protein [Aureispira sp.]